MDDQNYIVFESYLLKELSKDETKAFEIRLDNDLEFNKAFVTYKELSSFLEHKFENKEASAEFQENLKKISDTHFNKTKEISERKTKSKTFNLFKYAIAASVVVMLGVFTFNQFSNPTYNDFNTHEAIQLTVRGDQNNLLSEAEKAFNTNDYAKAEEAFKRLIEADTDNSEWKFYRAIANIELNNFEVADGLLETLQKGNSAFKNKATWYLALSKLKQQKGNECLKVLKIIPEGADDYEEAQKLIKKLD